MTKQLNQYTITVKIFYNDFDNYHNFSLSILSGLQQLANLDQMETSSAIVHLIMLGDDVNSALLVMKETHWYEVIIANPVQLFDHTVMLTVQRTSNQMLIVDADAKYV